MQADDAAPTRGEGLEVTEGLRGFQHREIVARTGDDQAIVVVARDLDEEAVRGAALVELACGVQVAWPEPERGREPQPITQQHPQRLELVPHLARRVEIRLDGE